MRASVLGANGGSDKSTFGRVDTDPKKLLNMLLSVAYAENLWGVH